MQLGAFIGSPSTKCISLQQGILPSDEVAKELVLTRDQLMEFSTT